MNIKMRQRTNGDVSKKKWEEDDALDKLGPPLRDHEAQLAEKLETQDKDLPVPQELRPQQVEAPWTQKPSKPAIQRTQVPAETTPKAVINAKELIEVIVTAYMASDEDRVTIEVQGNDILIEQVIEENGLKYKHSFRIGITHYKTDRRRLIK